MDNSSEITSLSGLVDIESDSVYTSELNANSATLSSALVKNNLSVLGNISVGGDQYFSGDTVIEGDTYLNQNVYIGDGMTGPTGTILSEYIRENLSGGTGILYDPSSGIISSLGSVNYWTLSGTGPTGYIENNSGSYVKVNELRTSKIVSNSGNLTLGDDVNSVVVNSDISYINSRMFVGKKTGFNSQILLNANSSGSSAGDGIWVRDDSALSTVFGTIPIFQINSGRDGFNFKAPANQYQTISLRPKNISFGSTGSSEIILSDPYDSSQIINSSLVINGSQNIQGQISSISPMNVTRDSSNIASKIVMNSGAGGTGTRVGVYYNQNASSAEYPLLVSSSSGQELVLSTPSNAGLSDIRISPKQEVGVTGSNYVLLTRPNAPQTIDSSLSLSTGTFQAPIITGQTINASSNLHVGGVSYKNGFGATGYAGFSYTPSSGIYNLDISSLQNQSRWDQSSLHLYPKASLGVEQLLIGSTTPSDFYSGIHLKSNVGRAKVFVESTNNAYDAGYSMRANSKDASIIYNGIDNKLMFNTNLTSQALTIQNSNVGIGVGSPSCKLDIQDNTLAVVSSLKNSNSSGYGLFKIDNDVGSGLEVFVNGSLKSSDGGVNNATIRSGISGDIRLQDTVTIAKTGSNLTIGGDPLGNPSQMGSSSQNITMTKSVYDPVSGFTFVCGNYTSSTIFNVKQLSTGLNSVFTLPISTVQNAFLLKYDGGGNCQGAWSFRTNRISSARCIAVGKGRVYIGGMYSSNGSTIIYNLTSTTSPYSFQSTSTGYFGAYMIGWNIASGDVERRTLMYDSSPVQYEWFSDILVDSSSNVYATGNLTTGTSAGGNANVRDLYDTPTSTQIFNTAGRQIAFILKWDGNGYLSARWDWREYMYSFGNSIDISNITNGFLFWSGIVYNTGGAVNPRNFDLSVSGYVLPQATAVNSVLLKFNLPSLVLSGIFYLNNSSAPVLINNIVRYSAIPDKWYYYTQRCQTSPAGYQINMNSSTTSNLQPPINSSSFGMTCFIINNDSPGGVYGSPLAIDNYSTGTSDIINDIHINRFTGECYMMGTTYSANTSQLRGWYATASRLKFPANHLHCGFCLVSTLNIPRYLYTMPYNQNFSMVSDIVILNNSDFYLFGLINSTSAQTVYDFDGVRTGYSFTSSGGINQMWACAFDTEQQTFYSFKNNGLTIGPSGRPNVYGSQLHIDKGISTNTFLRCKEIRSPDYTPPVFSDDTGRQIATTVNAWCNYDGASQAQPFIKSSMNIYSVAKIANGIYYLYISQPCPHKNYTINISSTSYSSNNYTVFPFLQTNSASGFSTAGIPSYKDQGAFSVVTVNTAGQGFDLGDISVTCCW